MSEFQLDSKRLYLRRITQSDLNYLLKLDSNPEVMRYIGPVKTERDQIQRVIDYIIDYYSQKPGLGIFAAITKDTQEFIGWFELANLEKTEEIELGYRLLPEFWDKGYASEMSTVLRDYAFDKIGLQRIAGITHHENFASQRVLQKTGLIYQKDAHYYNLDVKYFSLTKIAHETTIRPEEPADFDAITRVNDQAFGQPNEGELVCSLRTSKEFIPELSLIAVYNGQVIGHILFTISTINKHVSLTLAPLAVTPEYQNQGIGSRLIVSSRERARQLGYTSINVVGHPEYYPRFGFRKASQWKLELPFEVPDEVFMALELEKNALYNISGTVVLPAAFNKFI